MGLSHKAFALRYTAFSDQLRPLLEEGLCTGSTERLREFIEQNRERLKDPYEGEPLPVDWLGILETHDVHQFGDLALTAYYEPDADIGLGDTWQGLQVQFEGEGFSPILGTPLISCEVAFDPGKLGSYFQSPMQVAASISRLRDIRFQTPEVKAALGILQNCPDGIYVVF